MSLSIIKGTKPCIQLKSNPYAFPEIFSEEIDLNLRIVEERDNGNILLFERLFNGSAGFSLVVCKDSNLVWDEFTEIYEIYCEFVKRLGKGDFKEVEPIVIAKEYASEVLEFIEAYNNQHRKRKPFRLFTF